VVAAVERQWTAIRPSLDDLDQHTDVDAALATIDAFAATLANAEQAAAAATITSTVADHRRELIATAEAKLKELLAACRSTLDTSDETVFERHHQAAAEFAWRDGQRRHAATLRAIVDERADLIAERQTAAAKQARAELAPALATLAEALRQAQPEPAATLADHRAAFEAAGWWPAFEQLLAAAAERQTAIDRNLAGLAGEQIPVRFGTKTRHFEFLGLVPSGAQLRGSRGEEIVVGIDRLGDDFVDRLASAWSPTTPEDHLLVALVGLYAAEPDLASVQSSLQAAPDGPLAAALTTRLAELQKVEAERAASAAAARLVRLSKAN